MMGASAGSVPTMLRKEALVATVRLFDDAVYNEFPVQALFGEPVVYAENELVIAIQRTLRKLGTAWKSGPHTADPEVLADFTKKIVSAYYLAKSYRIPPGHLNQVRMLDQIADGLLARNIQVLAQTKAREIAEAVAQLTLFIRRQFEKLCIDVLNNTSFSLTVDGATQTFSGFLSADNAKTAAASWATASTGILEEWADWQLDFRRLAGGAPTHVLVPSDFFASYIMPNDDLRDFLIRNPEFISADARRMVGDIAGQGAERRFEVITVDARYDNDGSSAADLWPEGKMVWVRDPARCLRAATVATEDNDYNGGLYAYTFDEVNPKTTNVVVNFNAVPLVLDPNCVMHFDLTP